MTSLVKTTRELIAGETLTLLPQFFTVMALTVVLVLAGLVLVRVAMPLIIERWSA